MSIISDHLVEQANAVATVPGSEFATVTLDSVLHQAEDYHLRGEEKRQVEQAVQAAREAVEQAKAGAGHTVAA